MTKEERQGDAARTEFVAAIASAPAWFNALGYLGKFKYTKGLASLFDPRTAKTGWGLVRKGVAFSLIEEMTTGLATDPRITGSAVSLFSEKLDPAMQQGITRKQAYFRKVPIDGALAVFIGGAGDLADGFKLDQNIKIKEFLESIATKKKEAQLNVTQAYRKGKVQKSYTRKATDTRDFLEKEGVIKKDADGRYSNGDAVRPETAEEAEASLTNKYIPADNSKPEVTTIVETIRDNTDLAGKLEIQRRTAAGENTTEVVADVTGREQTAAAPDAKFSLSTAPTSSLSGSKYYEDLESIDLPTLRAMASSDEAFVLDVLSLTGKEPSELKRLDLIEAFKKLEEIKGVSVLPNRLAGQQVASLA